MVKFGAVVFVVGLLGITAVGWGHISSTTVTPGNLKVEGYSFDVKAEVRAETGEVEFKICVRTAAGREKVPEEARRGSLFVNDAGGTSLGWCDVAPGRDEVGVLVYRFTLARAVLERSRFHFAEYGWVNRRDEAGRERVELMPSVEYYEFPLGRFVEGEGPRGAATAPVATTRPVGAGAEFSGKDR
jgi:hypothetical protein